MTVNEIHEKLKAKFGDDVSALSEPKIDPFCTVKAARLVELCQFLKATPGLEFDFLEDETAVDRPKRSVIEVVYHLYSYKHRHGFVLKVEADRANPAVPTVWGVWKAAEWLEREIYDLFGVAFDGHPDLRRIMLPDDWVGHPLRKDFVETGGYHGVPNVRENPLIELRRLDEVRMKAAAEERKKAAPPAPAAPETPAAPPPPAAKA